MSKVTENSTVKIRVPVAAKTTLDAVKEAGMIGYDSTSETATVCPGDGLNYKRMLPHPGDVATDAGTLGGSEALTVVTGAGIRKTTLQKIWDGVLSVFVRQDNLADQADPAKGAGLVGYKGRTVVARLGDVAQIDDYASLVVEGDWSAAIAAALATGKMVQGAHGTTYGVGATVTMPDGSRWSDTALTVLDGTNAPAIVLGNGCILANVDIEANGSNNTSTPIPSAVILGQGKTGFFVSECKISNAYSSGIRINSCAQFDLSGNVVDTTLSGFTEHAGIYVNECEDGGISHNRVIDSSSNGFKLRGDGALGTYTKRIRVVGNMAINAYYIGFANGRIQRCVIANNVATDCGDNGIDVNGSSNVAIAGNSCFNNGLVDHVSAGFPQGDGVYVGENNSQTISVTGNTCSGNTRAGFGCVSSFSRTAVVGNVLDSNKWGAYLPEGIASVFSDNIITRNASAGIHFVTGANSSLTRCAFVGNTLDGNGARVTKSTAPGGSQSFSDNIVFANRGLTLSDIVALGWDTTLNNNLLGDADFTSAFFGTRTGIVSFDSTLDAWAAINKKTKSYVAETDTNTALASALGMHIAFLNSTEGAYQGGRFGITRGGGSADQDGTWRLFLASAGVEKHVMNHSASAMYPPTGQDVDLGRGTDPYNAVRIKTEIQLLAIGALPVSTAARIHNVGGVLYWGGVRLSFPPQSGLGAAMTSRTAGGTYGATEQTMLQEAHDQIRALKAALVAAGIIAP